MLDEKIQKLLNNLIQVEQVSTTLYLAMSAYMATRNYPGFSHWLRVQSDEEKLHMLKLIKYVTDRGGFVELQSIPAQPVDFGSPSETFQKVLDHEKFVTNSYRQAFDYAQNTDAQTAVLLQDFLREQVDEEAQAQLIVDRFKVAQNNPAALLLLDQELGKRGAAAPATAPAPPAGG